VGDVPDVWLHLQEASDMIDAAIGAGVAVLACVSYCGSTYRRRAS
jgi:hypothetical protein